MITFVLANPSMGQLPPSPYSRIDGTFEGWEGDTIVKLINGEYWQQASYSYQYAYKFMPNVYLYKQDQAYVMQVDGLSPVHVVPLNVNESRIRGSFQGWRGDTIVELVNGQIWKQSQFAYEYRYSYNPSVIIYKLGRHYVMYVDGTSDVVQVTRLK